MKKVPNNFEDECKKMHDLGYWSGFVKAFFDSIDGCTQKLPCMLKKCVAEVVKISRDVRLNHFVTILKIARFDIASYAQYISESQWHSVNETLYLNAIQLSSTSSINYCVTAAWRFDESEIPSIEYGYVSLDVVKNFHQHLSHSEEILYLAVLIAESTNSDCSRLIEILGKLTLEKLKVLIENYVKCIHTTIEVEDFSDVQIAKAPFSAKAIQGEAKLEISSEELFELLILLGRTYKEFGAMGCLQFIDQTHLKTISSSGIQAVTVAMSPTRNADYCPWKIPEDWIKQATYMAWEEIVEPPVTGMPDIWSADHDSELLMVAIKLDFILSDISASRTIWDEIVDKGKSSGLLCLLQMESLNMEFASQRLKYLKKLVMTQGRFLEETDLTLEFASCEKPVRSNATVPMLLKVKNEPIDNSFQVPLLKQEVQKDSTGVIEKCLPFPIKEEACPTEEMGREQIFHGEDFEAFDETLNSLKEEMEGNSLHFVPSKSMFNFIKLLKTVSLSP